MNMFNYIKYIHHIKMLRTVIVVLCMFDRNINGQWLNYRNHRYYFSSETMTPFQASTYCQDRQAELTSINSLDEHSFLAKETKKRAKSHFIGLWVDDPCQGRPCPSSSECAACRRRWRWLDGSPMLDELQSLWKSDEPDGSGNCAGLYTTWWDTWCKNRGRFICKKEGDDCFNHTCVHGQCEDGMASYSCNCTGTGFKGDKCQYDINDCDENECVNGRCIDGISSYTCDCTGTGFGGKLCEIDIDDCIEHECVNGHCKDGIKSYTCDCKGTGFEGKLCENDINFCVGNKCLNGRCIDGFDSYTCDCTGTGYEGELCEQDIDDCVDGVCGNGRCKDGINSYKCDCNRTGYDGDNCEQDIDECKEVPNPCGTASCTNNLGGYSCEPGIQNTYFTIGMICASILIGLTIICLVFSLYKNWKQRKTMIINSPNQNVNNIDGDVSTKSSLGSIYDEIELYDSARTESTHPTSLYTVLTRDPYGYDELYGLQRRIAILVENTDQNNEQSSASPSGFKAISLPTDLNTLVEDDNVAIEEAEYVEMLPEKLESYAADGKIAHGRMGRSKSMNDVVKSERNLNSEGKGKINTNNQPQNANDANIVSVQVQVH